MSHLALYGNVSIRRAYCPDCEGWSLVLAGILQCCDRPEDTPVDDIVRMTQCDSDRIHLSASARREILTSQAYRCFWCERSLNTFVSYKGKPRRLRTHFDHMIPFAYSQDNSLSNLVATCDVCNAWKSDYVFDTIENCRIFLTLKWDEMAEKYAKKLQRLDDAGRL